MSPDGEYLLIIAGLCIVTLLALAVTALLIGPEGKVRRPHLPRMPGWLLAAHPRHRTDRWALLRRARGWLA